MLGVGEEAGLETRSALSTIASTAIERFSRFGGRADARQRAGEDFVGDRRRRGSAPAGRRARSCTKRSGTSPRSFSGWSATRSRQRGAGAHVLAGRHVAARHVAGERRAHLRVAEHDVQRVALRLAHGDRGLHRLVLLRRDDVPRGERRGRAPRRRAPWRASPRSRAGGRAGRRPRSRPAPARARPESPRSTLDPLDLPFDLARQRHFFVAEQRADELEELLGRPITAATVTGTASGAGVAAGVSARRGNRRPSSRRG